MKGKILLLSLIISTFLLINMGFAFQNEPDGFRGLKWGNPPTKNMVFYDNFGENVNIYFLLGEKLSIGRAQFRKIHYWFYDKRLAAVSMNFDGKENFDLLESICQYRFGTETTRIEDTMYEFYLVWKGKMARIHLQYNSTEETGTLILESFIMEEWRKEIEGSADETEEDW